MRLCATCKKVSYFTILHITVTKYSYLKAHHAEYENSNVEEKAEADNLSISISLKLNRDIELISISNVLNLHSGFNILIHCHVHCLL